MERTKNETSWAIRASGAPPPPRYPSAPRASRPQARPRARGAVAASMALPFSDTHHFRSSPKMAPCRKSNGSRRPVQLRHEQQPVLESLGHAHSLHRSPGTRRRRIANSSGERNVQESNLPLLEGVHRVADGLAPTSQMTFQNSGERRARSSAPRGTAPLSRRAVGQPAFTLHAEGGGLEPHAGEDAHSFRMRSGSIARSPSRCARR